MSVGDDSLVGVDTIDAKVTRHATTNCNFWRYLRDASSLSESRVAHSLENNTTTLKLILRSALIRYEQPSSQFFFFNVSARIQLMAMASHQATKQPNMLHFESSISRLLKLMSKA